MPTDTYGQIVNSSVGRFVAKRVGLPQPVELDRCARATGRSRGGVLLGAAPGDGAARRAARRACSPSRARDGHDASRSPVRARAAAAAGLDAAVFNPEAPGDQRFKALVFDATGIADSAQLVELHAFFHPTIRRVRAVRPRDRARHAAGAGGRPARGDRAARAGGLHALARQGGRPRRDGAARLRRAGRRGPDRRDAALLPLAALGVRVGPGRARSRRAGGTRRSTGSARSPAGSRSSPAPRAGSAPRSPGRSRATARTSSGSTCPRSPTTSTAAWSASAARRSSSTSPPTTRPRRSPSASRRRASTSSSTTPASRATGRSAKMPSRPLAAVIVDVNLPASERINDALLDGGRCAEDGRIVCVSSMSGIAGNAGQTNYATSKAGVIGMVEALAPVLRERGRRSTRSRRGSSRRR